MSTLNVSNITDGTTTVGTSYVVNGSAKAWVHASTISTYSIFDSLNTSSITDSGSGVMLHNFSSNFAANNNIACVPSSHWRGIACHDGVHTSYARIVAADNNATTTSDRYTTTSVCHGDLA